MIILSPRTLEIKSYTSNWYCLLMYVYIYSWWPGWEATSLTCLNDSWCTRCSLHNPVYFSLCSTISQIFQYLVIIITLVDGQKTSQCLLNTTETLDKKWCYKKVTFTIRNVIFPSMFWRIFELFSEQDVSDTKHSWVFMDMVLELRQHAGIL